MLTMDKKIKESWIKALRSEEYAQGTGALKIQKEGHTTPGYCCLGVLTDLYIKEVGDSWTLVPQNKSEIDYGDNDMVWEYKGDTGLLPACVVHWAKISPQTGGVHSCNRSPYIEQLNYPLIILNDGSPAQPALSFAEISEVIEKYIVGVEDESGN